MSRKTKKLSPKQSYNQLRDLWYKKLADAGFEDAEQTDGRLKIWSSKFAATHSLVTAEAKATYYQLAATFLNDYQFESELEKTMWEYHANGISVRQISKLLAKVGIEASKDTVWNVVNRLEKSMKAMYLAKDEHE